jgi:RNA polymerase sigma-32 factor
MFGVQGSVHNGSESFVVPAGSKAAFAKGQDPTVSHFIAVAHAAPRLSREEEVALLTRIYEHGDAAAKEELMRSNLRHVVSIAMKYRRYGLPLADLFAEGNFGLVRALEKFDPSRGFRFVTYAAYWIRAYVLGYVLKHWSLVNVGVRSKHFFKLRRERRRIEGMVSDSSEALALLSERTGLTPARLEEMLQRLDSRDVSLDAQVFQDGATTLVDRLPSDEPNQDEQLEKEQDCDCAKRIVTKALASLDPRERLVIENRLLADGEDERTLADLGRELGISRERARQLEVRGRRKLRERITELAQNDKGCESLLPEALVTAA